MTTQTDKVLDYLRQFDSITPLEAFRDLACMRLGARIWELKKRGHNISVETVPDRNRFGQEVRYARYRLVAEKGQGELL